jgi:8-oxo-dGTP pyrophosphatase MutT (NUDIX family)
VEKVKGYKTTSSRIDYKTKWLSIRHDEVILPNGTESTYDVIEMKDFVLAIPKFGDKLILVEQTRYPLGQKSLEFPQGMVDEGEKMEKAALRECEEETGKKANKIAKLGSLWTAPGRTPQGYDVYLLDDLEDGTQHLDSTEADLERKILGIDEIKDQILNGKIRCGKTVAAFNLYLLTQFI